MRIIIYLMYIFLRFKYINIRLRYISIYIRCIIPVRDISGLLFLCFIQLNNPWIDFKKTGTDRICQVILH